MIDQNSRLKKIYRTSIGHDVITKLLMQLGKKETIITNPIVGNLKLKTVKRFMKGKLDSDFFDTFIHLINHETEQPKEYHGPIQPAWWKEAVFYQIYPRSFRDSNGDGIGDLPGIIEKLDYLKDLGVSALWLSPIYDSPNDDNGYDIRDYQKIMKEFGTMEDFDLLLEGVHKRGMRLIMDLVVNHVSDEHKWFQSAIHDENSPYRNYFHLHKGGTEAPNNWTSFFSGPAWNYYPDQNVWALHLFSKKQMDLNWDYAPVREDIESMVNWWLDKGIDGFRMDVINYISKDPGLPDGNEVVGKLMGYYGIEHYYYGPHLHEYLKELNSRCFAPHQAFSVGETPGLGMQMSKMLTASERHELNMIFSFDHLETPGHTKYDDYAYDLNYYRDYMTDWMEHYGNNCQMSLFYNNHDNPRMISKVNPNPAYREALAKLLAVMQFTLRGTPFIFQGDEMGLTNYRFDSIDQITDVEAKGLYAELIQTMSEKDALAKICCGTREHARIPLPWDDCNGQLHIDYIITQFYHDILAFRKDNQAIYYGDFKVLNKDHDRFVYQRTKGYQSYIIDCNLGTDKQEAYIPDPEYQLVTFTKHMPQTKQETLLSYGFQIWSNH